MNQNWIDETEIKQKSLIFVESVEFLSGDPPRIIRVHPLHQLRCCSIEEPSIMLTLFFFVLLLVAVFDQCDHISKLQKVIVIAVKAVKGAIDDAFNLLLIISLNCPWGNVEPFLGFPGLFLAQLFRCTETHRYFYF